MGTRATRSPFCPGRLAVFRSLDCLSYRLRPNPFLRAKGPDLECDWSYGLGLKSHQVVVQPYDPWGLFTVWLERRKDSRSFWRGRKLGELNILEVKNPVNLLLGSGFGVGGYIWLDLSLPCLHNQLAFNYPHIGCPMLGVCKQVIMFMCT